MTETIHRLYRSRTERMLGGVCAGLAHYLNTDPTIIRLLAIIGIFFWPPTPLVYFGLWLLIPEEPVAGSVTPPSGE